MFMAMLSLCEPLCRLLIDRINTLTLRERYGTVVWENLRVKFDELVAIIRDLKGYR
jgi:hypothetical protein